MKRLSDQERHDLINRYAQNWYEIRVKHKLPGTKDGDWEKAESIVEAEHPSYKPRPI